LCNRNGGGITFECPEGTRFQQRTMVCDHEYSVNCSDAFKYYDANLRIGHRNVNLLDDVTEGKISAGMEPAGTGVPGGY
jgi:Chitin binding Peritrophin-A domain